MKKGDERGGGGEEEEGGGDKQRTIVPNGQSYTDLQLSDDVHGAAITLLRG
jgi:hypothetical protein